MEQFTAGRNPFSVTTVEQAPKKFFTCLFFRSISIAHFIQTYAFLVLDLAGKPFGGDVEQLSPCKMKKNVPHS